MAGQRWAPPAVQRGVSVDDKMTCAELVAGREYLGLTGSWIARAARVTSRTERRWEAGESEIPDYVDAIIATLGEVTQKAIDLLAEGLSLFADPGIVLLRNDEQYTAAGTGGVVLPARWHRLATVRLATRVPHVMIAFEGEKAPRGDWLRPIIAVEDLAIRMDEVRYTTTRLPVPF